LLSRSKAAQQAAAPVGGRIIVELSRSAFAPAAAGEPQRLANGISIEAES
jgi:hypothetical protein